MYAHQQARSGLPAPIPALAPSGPIRRLGQRHQLRVLSPPTAPSAAPFGSDDILVESTGDVIDLTYAYAYEALEVRWLVE